MGGPDDDPDLDPARTGERLRAADLAAVAAGGMLGAEARYGLGSLTSSGFPWMTLSINVAGCLLIGVLMGVLARVSRAPRLVRPFLATGVLGGFTTFSAFAVDVADLGDAGRWAAAAGYLVGTVVLCIAAVVAGLILVARTARR